MRNLYIDENNLFNEKMKNDVRMSLSRKFSINNL